MINRIIFITFFLLSVSCSISQTNPDDKYWSSDFAIPTTDEVRALLVDGDYVYLNEFGRLVRWNLNNFEYEILGVSAAGSIYCIVRHDDYIYIGGNFEKMNGTQASFIAKWKDGVWDTVATGLNGKVNAICFDKNDNLWIGGQFTTVNGFESNYIACRKNNIWEKVEGFNGQVRTIVSRDTIVYAGGDFNFYNPAQTEYSLVAVYDGIKWSNLGMLGSNSGGKVMSLNLNELGYIIAGGIFENDGATSISPNIAYYNGSLWKPAGEGLDGMVLSVSSAGNKIFAGGYFKNSGTTECKSIAVFDNSQWKEISGGISGSDYPSVLCMSNTSQGLFIGGNFTKAGTLDCWNTALLNEQNEWVNFQPTSRNGTISSVACFTIDKKNDMLYAGGGFVRTGNVISYGISKFDGKDWLGCNSGFTPTSNVVYSIQAVNDTVYFTGWFNYADGIRLHNVARWIDSKKTWESIGNGIDGGDGDMGSILVTGEKIYVSGNFKYVMNGSDTVFANYISYWDGQRWNRMNNGMGRQNNKRVYIKKIIESPEGHIIVVGTFDFAGSNGKAFNYAEWDPDSLEWKWETKYFSNSVNTILYDAPYYYYGGSFDSAGVLIDVNGIVRQNSETGEWQKCGNGVDGIVNALVKWGDDIYIGGRFKTASGKTCNSVAKYNPASNEITPLGSGLVYGVNYSAAQGVAIVSDMIVYKNELYFGGMITSAGGRISSSNIAKWTNAPLGVETKQNVSSSFIISPNPANDYIEISYPPLPPGEGWGEGIRIYDLLGVEIQSTPVIYADTPAGGGQVRLDISSLSSGVYFVRVGNDVKKFVKI